MRPRFALLCVAVTLLCWVPTATGALFPEAHSPVQQQWQKLFMTTFWIALFVGVLVEGMLIFILIRFRRRKDGPQEGPQIHGNTKMEIAWTIAPAMVMGWLLIISYQGLSLTDNSPDPEFYVQVTGSQFSWTFEYPDGKTSIGTLRVEQDRRVGLNVTSEDVIHAFSVPQLGVMIDAVPGSMNYFWFTADAPGDYHAQCRELCNNEFRAGHGEMIATVTVFPPGEQALPWGTPVGAAPAPSPTPGGNATGNQTGNQTADETVSLSPAGNFKLDPALLEADKGENLTIGVSNDDPRTVHNLYIGIYDESQPDNGAKWKSEDLEKGQKGTFTAGFPDEDVTYEMWCNIPGHRQAGMTGDVKVGAGKERAEGPEPLLPGPGLPLVILGLVGLVLFLRRRE